MLGVPKCNPSKNREMGRAQALGGCQSLKKCNNQLKNSVGHQGGCLTRNANKGNGDKGGRQATATRAMAMAMLRATTTAMATAMAMTWAMATGMRVAGDKEEKGKGGKGNGKGDEGGR